MEEPVKLEPRNETWVHKATGTLSISLYTFPQEAACKPSNEFHLLVGYTFTFLQIVSWVSKCLPYLNILAVSHSVDGDGIEGFFHGSFPPNVRHILAGDLTRGPGLLLRVMLCPEPDTLHYDRSQPSS